MATGEHGSGYITDPDKALKALVFYWPIRYGEDDVTAEDLRDFPDEMEMGIRHLLVDLQHLAERSEIDFGTLLCKALLEYREEAGLD